ncbi:MAG: phosphotransferase [Candidatus Heimdallarchaeota archaeon]|nr:phosphotransferase [Candidatus Heimdallarchaeota archaeon]
MDDQEKEKILMYLDSLQDDAVICHGDFHPDTILIGKQGPVTIDWLTVCKGNPAADVARTRLLLSLGTPPTNMLTKFFIMFFRSLFYHSYLNHYLEISGMSKSDVDSWMLPIYAARLVENLPGEKYVLLDAIQRELNHLQSCCILNNLLRRFICPI